MARLGGQPVPVLGSALIPFAATAGVTGHARAEAEQERKREEVGRGEARG